MMRADRIASVAAICALALAVGCVGDGTDNANDPKKREEASQLNLQLGIDYYRQGNLIQAKDKIDRALEQDPQNPTVQATAGLLYDRLGQAAKAEKHYRRAVSLDPKNPDIHNSFAVFLCRHGKSTEGEKQALTAAANPLYKTPEAALLNAGVCARTAGDPKRAEQYLRRALSLQPRFAQALLEMADLEFENKNYLPARGFLERHLAAQPPGPTALWLGVRLEGALGNRAAANDYARRLKNEFPTSSETKQLLDYERGRR